MRRLALLPLLLAACSPLAAPRSAVQYQPGYRVAPSATMPADVIATRDAAQLQIDASNRATQQVQQATQSARDAVKWQIDTDATATILAIDAQRQAQEVAQTQIAMTVTTSAYFTGMQLTALSISGQKSMATEAATYREMAMARAKTQAEIDAQSAKFFANAWGALQLVLVGAVGWALLSLVNVAAQRWRAKPIIAPGPNGPIIFQLTEPRMPEVSAPEPAPLPYQNQRALEFLDACLLYRIRRPEFPGSQVPSDERLEAEGIHGWRGGNWQRVVDSLGNLLEPRPGGTFCRDHDIAELRQHIASGYYQLPYPIAAPVPHRSTVPASVESGGAV